MSQNLQNFVKFQKFQLYNLVDFEKCCKTRIFLQKSVLIQLKTSNILPKFAKNRPKNPSLPSTRPRQVCGPPRRLARASLSRPQPAENKEPPRFLLRRLTPERGMVYLGIPTNRFSQRLKKRKICAEF